MLVLCAGAACAIHEALYVANASCQLFSMMPRRILASSNYWEAEQNCSRPNWPISGQAKNSWPFWLVPTTFRSFSGERPSTV